MREKHATVLARTIPAPTPSASGGCSKEAVEVPFDYEGTEGMQRRIDEAAVRHAVAVTLGALALLALVGTALAQLAPGAAEIKALTARVEIQKKGDAQWTPAAVGARLVEGDSIRAWAGASARLDLPDGSTIFLAENSRVVMGKLEFDQQNQARDAVFHLAVGKVRAVVSQAALSLVKARKSNFSISTQTAVAAVRGTDFEVTYDDVQQVMRIAVLPETGGGGKGDGS
jgi:hypothetical protein